MPRHWRPDILLIGQIACVVLSVACAAAYGSAPIATSSPPSTTTVTTSPSPSATPTFAPVVLMVGNTDGEGVFVRQAPSDEVRVSAWPDRSPMIVTGPDREADGRRWRPVVAPDGSRGWVPAEYLVDPAPSVLTTAAQQTAVPLATAEATPTPATPTPTPSPVAQELPVRPGVNLTQETRFYRIEGLTEEEIRQQLHEHGPVTAEGRFAGHTTWTVNWSYRFSTATGACAISAVDVIVQVVYTMPHWDPQGPVPAALRERWTQFFAALQTHEYGHRDLATQAAADVQQEVRALPPAVSCDALRELADAAAERVLADYREREVEYDRATNHGETQGARW